VSSLIEEVLPEEGLIEIGSRLKVKESRPRAEPWIPKEELSYVAWPGPPGYSEGVGCDWPLAPR
jgi:hypothetical protein